MIYRDRELTIYFGDSSDKIPSFQKDSAEKNFVVHEAFERLGKILGVKGLMFLKQVHGADGLKIENELQIKLPLDLFNYEGDILLSRVPNVGIGVLTADCLPIVIYDTAKKVVSVVHAGWRGSLHHVVPSAINLMHKNFNSQNSDLRIFFGPSAGPCCYEVRDDFIKQLKAESPFFKQVLIKKDKMFFDIALLNKLQLKEVGIKEYQIDECHNLCTICNDKFESHRRSQGLALRQATVAFVS